MATTTKRISADTLDAIREAANDNIDNVLSALGMDVENSAGFGDEIRCSCPIHGGDNPTGFSYNTRFKQWRCYTHKCHEGSSNIYGLVQKLLTKQRGDNVGFRESVNWLSDIVGIPLGLEDCVVSQDDQDVRSMVRDAKIRKRLSTKRPKDEEDFKPFPVKSIEGKIDPSPYFLKQGFTENVLRKYNVGFCTTKDKPMYMRSYAPVLDEVGEMVIGVTGRTINEPCQYCPEFHIQGQGCPKDNPKIKGYPKWKHYGFNKMEVLYNSWFAEPSIRKTKTVVLTEGPKDVWWLAQHGLENCVAIFGLAVSDWHLKKLVQMGVLKVVVALDNDEPGIDAMHRVDEIFGDYFSMVNINNLLSSGADIADVPPERMVREVVPYLRSLEIN